MGLKIWQESQKNLFSCGILRLLREAFQILTITLLSLLLPLSFLLIARLITAHYLFAFSTNPTSQPPSLVFSFLLYTYPTLLHALVSIVSIAALVHGLTGRITLSNGSSPEPAARPRLYTAWIFLCTLQVCVGLGVEGSKNSRGVILYGSGLGYESSLLGKIIFFMGLHETMLHWSRTVVKPVVDDTVFGFSMEERWVERAAMAASFGFLWWWRLRDEVEALVVVAEVKRELSMGVGVADFVGWWLYYLTVTIGMVRLLKGLLWLGMVLLRRRLEGIAGDESLGNEEKV